MPKKSKIGDFDQDAYVTKQVNAALDAKRKAGQITNKYRQMAIADGECIGNSVDKIGVMRNVVKELYMEGIDEEIISLAIDWPIDKVVYITQYLRQKREQKRAKAA